MMDASRNTIVEYLRMWADVHRMEAEAGRAEASVAEAIAKELEDIAKLIDAHAEEEWMEDIKTCVMD